MALSDDKCEVCGESIRSGPEPQVLDALAPAGTREPEVGPLTAVEDAGFCSDACRDSYRAVLFTTPLEDVDPDSTALPT